MVVVVVSVSVFFFIFIFALRREKRQQQTRMKGNRVQYSYESTRKITEWRHTKETALKLVPFLILVLVHELVCSVGKALRLGHHACRALH
uniref:Putative tomosyn n=1 Tax=Ixodes ricinus TaxID=34613 RepID=A0A0K8RN84_IXORI